MKQRGWAEKGENKRRNQRYWSGIKATPNYLLVQLLDPRPGEIFVVTSQIVR